MAPRYQSPRPSFDKKLALYSAGAAALLAAAPAAGQSCTPPGTLVNGQYCYTDISDQTSSGAFNIDVDNDGTNEMQVFAGSVSIRATSLADVWRGADTGGTSYFAAYQSGQSISVARPAAVRSLCYYGFLGTSAYGPWAGVSNRFLGFSFQLDGQTHYGWVRMDVNGTCTSFTVKDYAYNTQANDPIPAGLGALPVELAGFSAVARGRAVELAWTTHSETNNAGFEIQRLERESWQAVAFVEGRGTTEEEQQYRHVLEEEPAGTHRYRLKQVDFDGDFDYSGEVEVHVVLTESYRLSAPAPNPVRANAELELEVGHGQQVRAALYDLLGREVTVLHHGAVAAGVRERLQVDAEALPAGIYLVRVEGETFTETQRLTVVR